MRSSMGPVAGALFVMLFGLSTISFAAEQRGAAPAQAPKVPVTAPKPAQAPAAIGTGAVKKPLVQPLVFEMQLTPDLCTSLVDTINSVIDIAHKDMQTVLKLYAPQGNNHITFPGIWELYYTGGMYRNHVKMCCSPGKSFSVQDQQAAGCSGSDTVKQCMDKLVKRCIGDFKSKAALRGQLNQSKDKAGKISFKTQQLADKLNQLTTMMP